MLYLEYAAKTIVLKRKFILIRTDFELKYFYENFKFQLIKLNGYSYVRYEMIGDKVLMNSILESHGYNDKSFVYDKYLNIISNKDIFLYDVIIVSYGDVDMLSVIKMLKLKSPNKLLMITCYNLEYRSCGNHMGNLINSEKAFSQKIGIVTSDFDYEQIRDKLNDVNLINRILLVIDKVMASVKMQGNIHYLILADFLFGMVQSSTIHSNTKTSRELYITYIVGRLKIYGFDHTSYLLLHLKLLVELSLVGILVKEVIIIKNKDGFGSWVYFYFAGSNQVNSNFFTGISTLPWYYVKINGQHYCVSSFRSMISSYRQDNTVGDSDFDLDYSTINGMCSTGYVFSEEIVGSNRFIIDDYKKKLEEELEVSDITLYKNEPINTSVKSKENSESFFKDDGTHYDNDNYVNNSPVPEYHAIVPYINPCVDLVELNYFDDKVNSKKFYKNKLKKKIQDINMLIAVYKKIIPGTEFYLPAFMDFRGRYYYASYLSPTYNKPMRSLMRIKKKRGIDLESLTRSEFFKKIIAYRFVVEKHNPSLANLPDHKMYFIICLYIEVGKTFINNDGSRYEFSTVEIIELGITNHKKRSLAKKLNDSLRLNDTYNALDGAILNDVYDWDTEVEKDATASGFLNLCLVYKVNGEDKLRVINRDGDNYCDIYSYLIIIFMHDLDPKYSYLRNRKVLKKLIMTIPYGAGLSRCMNALIDALKKELGIKYEELSSEDKKYIKDKIKKFYFFIKENAVELIYDINTSVCEVKKYNYKKVSGKVTSSFKLNVNDNCNFVGLVIIFI